MYNIEELICEDSQLGRKHVSVGSTSEVDNVAFFTISSSKPRFLPPIMSTELDGAQRFGYDVVADGYVPLTCASMTPTEFLLFMKNLTGALVKCEDYFMNPLNFILQEEYVYVKPDSFEVHMIYLPVVEPLYTESDISRQVYEIARKLSRRLFTNTNMWKDVISKLWNMSETDTVFDTNAAYIKLVNEQMEQEEKPADIKKQEPVIAIPKSILPTEPTALLDDTKKKVSNVFGGKKADDKQDQKSEKKGWFGKKSVPSLTSSFSWRNIFGIKKKRDTKIDVAPIHGNDSVGGAALYIMEHGARASRIDITKDDFLIGSSNGEVDGHIPNDAKISGVHARIAYNGGAFNITDKYSLSGTFLNDIKLDPRESTILDNGVIIKLGKTELLFERVA